MMKFQSNGKLLLTGEYVVLDGATALAVPTNYGQSLKVTPIEEAIIQWKSLDHQGGAWFEGNFPVSQLRKSSPGKEIFRHSGKQEVVKKLLLILTEADSMNPDVLQKGYGFEVITRLDFPLEWGLGTSSTLINNIAQWFKIDAYELLRRTFGGSGYDIAAAKSDKPITYQLTGNSRNVFTNGFNPIFKKELFFVHLNRKQNSRESIEHYRSQSREELKKDIEKITALTHSLIACETLSEFELLMEIHETVISRLIKTPKIKSDRFPDYPGAIKSLGGWGGDFILATGKEPERAYFRRKGYQTIVEYQDMVRW